MSKPIVMERGVKYRDADKMALIPVKNVATEREALLRKPEWMKIKLPADSTRIQGIKAAMRKNGLHSVCEEASCPNLAECFNHGTATFMILGAICTRRCPFCDVAHGRPVAPDANEPVKLAQTIADMALRYVVITSVDRDDLRDGGAQHFADCITAIRRYYVGFHDIRDQCGRSDSEKVTQNLSVIASQCHFSPTGKAGERSKPERFFFIISHKVTRKILFQFTKTRPRCVILQAVS